ncbi:MAG: alpha/beta hydrolase [Rhodobacteraceae bacterium]|nr:alpha/beta hydrolase [Paracoccaceae bacterium]
MYGQPPSQFIDIDGTQLHVRDEGSGPVLVLLHGSRASLHQWDGWVAALKSRYRIIRVDSLAHGLTGHDPSGSYSQARSTELLKGLLDKLGVDRFYLGGTSSGATEAVRFAAAYPERVEKMVLSTVPLKLPPTTETPSLRRFIFWFHANILGDTSTDLFWRSFLENIYGDPSKVTDDLVTRYRILNSLPDQRALQQLRIQNWYRDGGAEKDFETAAKVTSPTLVQWGVAGPVLPEDIQCEITAAFKNAQVRVISYPSLGHKLVMEDPVTTARDADRFLSGEDVGGACETPSR